MTALVSPPAAFDDDPVRRPHPRTSIIAAAQRAGATRAGVIVIGRVVSPLQRWLYRRTGGRLSLTGRAPVLLPHHHRPTDREGAHRPLLYVRDGDTLAICNVNPGSERPNPWVLNLRATPNARVQLGPDVFPVTARGATGAEVERLWPRLVRLWPAYESFHGRGGQRSVFLLQRTAGHLPSRPHGGFVIDLAVDIRRPARAVYAFLADIQTPNPSRATQPFE